MNFTNIVHIKCDEQLEYIQQTPKCNQIVSSLYHTNPFYQDISFYDNIIWIL